MAGIDQSTGLENLEEGNPDGSNQPGAPLSMDENSADSFFEGMSDDPEESFAWKSEESSSDTLPPVDANSAVIRGWVISDDEVPLEVQDDDSSTVTLPPQYRMLRLLGRGGFGEVWEAVQTSLGRAVAIKRPRSYLYHDSQPWETERSTWARLEMAFRQEALTMANLEHPNIVPVHDLTTDPDGRPILTMKTVRGKGWNEILWKDENLPMGLFLAKHLPILIDVAQAVAFAHSRGVVHRDLKPMQVLVGEFGEVLLTDWGLAMVYDDEKAEKKMPHLMASGLAPTKDTAPNPAGTPAYMAPEQTEETADNIGPWTDVYLLGGTLYYLLTMMPPHGKRDTRTSYRHARKGKVIPPDEKCPDRDIPEELSKICMRAMSKHPEERFDSTKEFIDALRDFLTGTTRHREAELLSHQAFEELAKAGTNYKKLENCLVMIEKIYSLWPSHSSIETLREQSLNQYAKAALQNGDLVLARLQAERIQNPKEKEEHLKQIAQEEALIDLHRTQRRHFKIATSVLLIVLMIGGSAALIYHADQRAKSAQRRIETASRLAEEANRRAREAEFRNYSANLKLAQTTLDEGKFDEAVSALVALPESMRGWEWGYQLQKCVPELLTLRGHSDFVQRGIFSPDSTKVLTSSLDGSVILWDAESGEVLHLHTAHSESVNDIDFNHDGSMFVTAGGDGKAVVWNTDNGQMVSSFNGHRSNGLITVDFHPTQNLVLTTSVDQTARLWDARSSREIMVYKGHQGPIWCAAFSPDGKKIITGSKDGTARIWDVDSGKELHRLEGHRQVGIVLASPSNDAILTASEDDNAARIWNATNGSLMASNLGHFQGITSAGFSHDGNMVATASWDGLVKLWHTYSSREFFSLSGHSEKISRVIFSPNNEYLLTCSHDETAKLWDIPSGREIATLVGHQGQIIDASFSPDGSRLLTTSSDHTAKIWKVPSLPETLRLSGHNGEVTAIRFSPTNDQLVSVSTDYTARLWDTRYGRNLVTFRGHVMPITSVAFFPSGDRIATGAQDQKVKIWDTHVGTCLMTLEKHTDVITSIDVSPPIPDVGHYIVSGSMDGTAIVWNVQSGEQIMTYKGHEKGILSVRFSPDGSMIASAGLDRGVRLWNIQGRTIRSPIAESEKQIHDLQFSPDGKLIATASESWQAKIWNVETGEEVGSLVGHTAPVVGLSFSPDGTRLVTGSKDGSARIWSVETGSELMRVQAHEEELTAVAFSTDGTELATASTDSLVKVWDPIPWRLKDLPGSTQLDWKLRFTLWQRDRSEEWSERCDTRGRVVEYWYLDYLSRSTVEEGRESMIQLLASVDDSLPLFDLKPEDRERLKLDLSETRTAIMNAPSDSFLSKQVAPLLTKMESVRMSQLIPPAAQWRRPVPNELLPEPFREYLVGVTGPIEPIEQISPLGGRKIQIMCLVPKKNTDNRLFISGDLEDLGAWTPNAIPMKFLGETKFGTMWEFRTRNVPMQFKFTFGHRGDDWIGTEEWPDQPNRTLPSQASEIYQTPDGNLIWLNVFGERPTE